MLCVSEFFIFFCFCLHTLEIFISAFLLCPLWPVLSWSNIALPKLLRSLVLLSRTLPCLHFLPLCYLLLTLFCILWNLHKGTFKIAKHQIRAGIIIIRMTLSRPISLMIHCWEAGPNSWGKSWETDLGINKTWNTNWTEREWGEGGIN